VKIPGEKPGVQFSSARIKRHENWKFCWLLTMAVLQLAVMFNWLVFAFVPHENLPLWKIAFFDGEEAVKEWSDTDSR